MGAAGAYLGRGGCSRAEMRRAAGGTIHPDQSLKWRGFFQGHQWFPESDNRYLLTGCDYFETQEDNDVALKSSLTNNIEIDENILGWQVPNSFCFCFLFHRKRKQPKTHPSVCWTDPLSGIGYVILTAIEVFWVQVWFCPTRSGKNQQRWTMKK